MAIATQSRLPAFALEEFLEEAGGSIRDAILLNHERGERTMPEELTRPDVYGPSVEPSHNYDTLTWVLKNRNGWVKREGRPHSDYSMGDRVRVPYRNPMTASPHETFNETTPEDLYTTIEYRKVRVATDTRYVEGQRIQYKRTIYWEEV